MTMSEMMDQAREELHKVGEQKNELEKLWKTEKHNWGMEKKVIVCYTKNAWLALSIVIHEYNSRLCKHRYKTKRCSVLHTL